MYHQALKLICLAFLIGGNTGHFIGRTFTKDYCSKMADVGSGVTFHTVSSWLGCALLCEEACSAFLLEQASEAEYRCAPIMDTADLPFATDCTDSLASVQVFSDMDSPTTTTTTTTTTTAMSCDGTMTIGFVSYCLKRQTFSAQRELAIYMCALQGGILAEAATLNDVIYIREIAGESVGRVWMGADDYTDKGTYVWLSGRMLDTALFCSNEPNETYERCIASNSKECLMDVSCDGTNKFVCAIAL